MITKFKKILRNRVFTVRVETRVTELEQDKIDLFGEPEVEVGGNFTVGSVTVNLPPQQRLIVKGFPFEQSFDGESLGLTAAEDQAEAWEVEMENRLQTAITDVRNLGDDFTGERTVQI